MTSKASILALIDSTRVRLGFGRDNTFIPTTNVRNPHMLEEAEAFSQQLRDFQRAVNEYHRNVQGFMRGMLPLLDANLPRVWTTVPETHGLAEPIRPAISHGHPSRVGGDYDGAAIMAHMDILDRSIEEEILAPLRRWQEGLQVARERMKSLEKLRKEVDGQRKKFEKKFSRSEQRLRRAYVGAGYGSSSSSSSSDDDHVVPRGKLLEDYQRLALHTERQLRAIIESYEDQERLVWEQLSGLVTDAAWLESYAAATMIKVKEAMQGVALALGPSKQPLPAYRPKPGVPLGVAYGEVGSNANLVKQMSPRAIELASGAMPRGSSVLPYQPLRAKRGTATPLLVAAAAASGAEQRLLAAEPVPRVQLGASGVPMDMVPRDVAHRAIRDVERRVAGEGIRVREQPAPAIMPSAAPAASPIVSTPTTLSTTGVYGPTGGGFRDSDRFSGFRDSGRDGMGFGRDQGLMPQGPGFRDQRISDSSSMGFSRDQAYEAQGSGLGYNKPIPAQRELSLGQGMGETGYQGTGGRAAAVGTGPMVQGIERGEGLNPRITRRESDTSSSSSSDDGHDADLTPRQRVMGQNNSVITDAVRAAGPDTSAPFSKVRDESGELGYERGAAAAEAPAAAAVGRRADDVLDTYASPVKMTSAEAARTTGGGMARVPGRTGSGMLRASESESDFQDARSEPYASRGTSISGIEPTPIHTTMNGSKLGLRPVVADAPYSPGAVSPAADDVTGLSKQQQQQQQMFDRPMVA